MILITGVSGFIGSSLAKKFLEQGYSVIGIDNFNSYYSIELKKYRTRIVGEFKEFYFEFADISNHNLLREIFKKYDITSIYHLASEVGVRHSIDHGDRYFTTNFLGTQNIINLVHEFNIKEVHFTSTSTVYEGNAIPFHEDMIIKNKLSNPYSQSKLLAEKEFENFCREQKCNVSVYRLFSVYGEYGRPDMFLFKLVTSLLRNQEITIYGDGNNLRDLTYIDDVIRALSLKKSTSGFQLYNIGAANPISINQLIEMCEKILQRKAKVNYTNHIHQEINQIWASHQKAKDIFSWQPHVPLEVGIQKTIQHIENHLAQDWY